MTPVTGAQQTRQMLETAKDRVEDWRRKIEQAAAEIEGLHTRLDDLGRDAAGLGAVVPPTPSPPQGFADAVDALRQCAYLIDEEISAVVGGGSGSASAGFAPAGAGAGEVAGAAGAAAGAAAAASSGGGAMAASHASRRADLKKKFRSAGRLLWGALGVAIFACSLLVLVSFLWTGLAAAGLVAAAPGALTTAATFSASALPVLAKVKAAGKLVRGLDKIVTGYRGRAALSGSARPDAGTRRRECSLSIVEGVKDALEGLDDVAKKFFSAEDFTDTVLSAALVSLLGQYGVDVSTDLVGKALKGVRLVGDFHIIREKKVIARQKSVGSRPLPAAQRRAAVKEDFTEAFKEWARDAAKDAAKEVGKDAAKLISEECFGRPLKDLLDGVVTGLVPGANPVSVWGAAKGTIDGAEKLADSLKNIRDGLRG